MKTEKEEKKLYTRRLPVREVERRRERGEEVLGKIKRGRGLR